MSEHLRAWKKQSRCVKITDSKAGGRMKARRLTLSVIRLLRIEGCPIPAVNTGCISWRSDSHWLWSRITWLQIAAHQITQDYQLIDVNSLLVISRKNNFWGYWWRNGFHVGIICLKPTEITIQVSPLGQGCYHLSSLHVRWYFSTFGAISVQIEQHYMEIMDIMDVYTCFL